MSNVSTSTSPSTSSTASNVALVTGKRMTILTTALPRDPFISDVPGAPFRQRVALPKFNPFAVGTILTTAIPDDPFVSDIPAAEAKALPSYFRRRFVLPEASEASQRNAPALPTVQEPRPDAVASSPKSLRRKSAGASVFKFSHWNTSLFHHL
ncbi:hypothetical protein B0H17DRAFT_1184058 [Mycena rosella]|uniref:Uncharacterized protein n=1 Tax=Mycena rosella TaxID=1033263 RepID=A0AAD7CX82_MYCRO|nr:hypothetical protein B0H17DRAFT_1184058 [Mycena rosella]